MTRTGLGRRVRRGAAAAAAAVATAGLLVTTGGPAAGASSAAPTATTSASPARLAPGAATTAQVLLRPGTVPVTGVVVEAVLSSVVPDGPFTASAGSVTPPGISLRWELPSLPADGAVLTLPLRHVRQGCGRLTVLVASYRDDQGSAVAVPGLQVDVPGCTRSLTVSAPDGPLPATSGTVAPVVATALDDFADPVPGMSLTFDVTSGPGRGQRGQVTTGSDGTARFSLVSDGTEGTSQVAVFGRNVVGTALGTSGRVVWAAADTEPPTVAFVGLQPAYRVTDVVDVSCTASDAGSGVATVDCPGARGPAYEFAPSRTLSASATDRAGNVGRATATVRVVVTHDDVCALGRSFSDKDGVTRALCAKLASARQRDRGDDDLRSYRNQVAAQSGKALTPQEAEVLTRLSRLL